MIHVHNLSFSYGKHTIFENISIPSEFLCKYQLIAIVGFNGAGKSTLLKLLSKQIKTHSGSIEFLTKNGFTYLPQQNQYDHTYPLSVYDVVSMPQRRTIGDLFFPQKNNCLIDCILKKVELFEFKNRPISTLSGGQFQRMLFARMLLCNQDILFLDEPFSSVDEKSTNVLINVLKEEKDKGKIILCVCHDLQLVRKFFNAVILVQNKNIQLFDIDSWREFERKQLG